MDEDIRLRDRFLAAPDVEAMLASAEKNAELWASVWRRTVVPASYVSRLTALGGVWHLLVLSEDWCGDAVNTVPVVGRLAELVPNVELRVLDRESNLDLMDSHLTGASRSIPVVMVLDEKFLERGWWGPRPRALQEWVLGLGHALSKEARYREVRTWYARDRGLTTLEEIVGLMERAALPALL